MNYRKHPDRRVFSKSKMLVSIQIILQGITPVALSFSPAIAFSAPVKSNRVLERQITDKQRAVIEADYIRRHHVLTGYTLKDNESLEHIARIHYVSVPTLREINRYRFPNDKDFNEIKAGQYLIVPKWTSAQQAADALTKCYSTDNIAGRSFISAAVTPASNEREKTPTTQRSTHQPPAKWVTDDATQPHDGQDKTVAQWLSGAGQIAQNGHATDAVKNMALNGTSQALTSQAENWLNQYGHARIQLNVNDRMHLDGSSADLLLPLHDANGVMTFTQLGVHDKNDYTTANLGLGQRWFSPQQMWGYNGFVDQEVRNNHTRLGLGLEYWRDYFRLAGNGYIGLTGWKESKNLQDYEEKAASGFDLRGNGYLPSMPEFGAKLSYEQYFGNNVGLFGKNTLQRDPFAVTAGVNYTPIPLVTTGIDYKQGKSGANDTQFSLQFNYLFGVPWQEQISAERVKELRTLNGAKLEFVDRNNNMVMQYRKMEMIKLSLPATLQGDAGTQQVVLATVKSRRGLSRVQWNSAALIAAGGSIKALTKEQYQITLPEKTGEFPLSAIAYDNDGNASNSASTRVIVSDSTPVAAISSLTPDVLKANADGIAPITYTLTTSEQTRVARKNGDGFKVKWNNMGVGTLSTAESVVSNEGKATVRIVSKLAGKVNLTATLVDAAGKEIAKKQDQQAEFVSHYAMSTLTASPAQVVADGKTPITWRVTASNNGAPLAGYTVNWTRADGIGDLEKNSSVTDSNGVATVNMTSTTAGATLVKATLLDSNGTEVASANGSGTFTPPTPTVMSVNLTVDRTSQWTDRSVTLNAEVKNGNGAVVPNMPLKWDDTDCTQCTTLADTTTDAQGKVSNITMTLQSGAEAGARTLKLCTTDATPSCSAPVTVTYYKSPEITGYQTLGGTEKTGAVFNEVRFKNGEFNIHKAGDSTLSYQWMSNSPAAASVDNNGKVTLLTSDGTDIILKASKAGLETREIHFTISNGKTWYSLSDKYSGYVAINTQLCKSPLVGASSESEFQAITDTWGDLSKYSGIAMASNISDAWIDGTNNNGVNAANAASIWKLKGSDTGTRLDHVVWTDNSYAVCR